MIYITNIWALPLILLIYSCNAYLFILTLRLVLSQLHATRDTGLCRSLADLTDPMSCYVSDLLERWTKKAVPASVPWLLIVLAIVIVRHFCMAILMRTN